MVYRHFPLLLLLVLCSLTGCGDPTGTQTSVIELNRKFDAFTKVYADVGQRDYHANLYSVVDTDRQQVIAYIHAGRSIQVGELMFIGDDIWRVQAAKIFTEEYQVSPTPAAGTPKLYRPSSNELLVKFEGKARTSQKDADASSKPDATP